ncbi:MAG: AAC(3) family N-acetyltransferase [Candidatus Acidiferrales bacterium]
MSFESRRLNAVRAGVRAALRRVLSQEKRTELKRLQSLVSKRLSPLLTLAYGTFNTSALRAELARRLPSDFEILMVHSSYDGLLPMYKGSASELLAVLIDVCGPERTLVMPSFVMGGRTFDTKAYFASRPFDVRRTPSETGMIGELFRRTPRVLRSLHPTCSICAMGPLAEELTTGHHVSKTGFTADSPFGTMNRRRTAILGLGVEYFRCLTHAHTAGHQMGEEYPIKFAKISTQVTLIDYDGRRYEYELGLPDRSKKLDLRVLWSVLSRDELKEWRFHGVPMFLVPEARMVTERLTEAARKGITIYGSAAAHNHSVATAQRTVPESQR